MNVFLLCCRVMFAICALLVIPITALALFWFGGPEIRR